MVMPGRKYLATSSSSYRYSINGQEKEKELNENITSAEFWQYDARLGRRWNIDPVLKTYESPYMAFSGNPIWFADANGADTTLPGGDGRNITLPTGASGISTFDGTAQSLLNSSLTVQPAAGTLQSFSINDKAFSAAFGDKTGNFLGYYSLDDPNLSYNDYAAQQAASGNGGMLAGLGGLSISLPGAGAGGATATGGALPAIPLAGAAIGWNYGATHADKISGWVQAIAGTVGGWLGEKVIKDKPTTVAPPPLPIMLYRGVHYEHPDYVNALMGIATPAGGNATPEQHAGGNYNSMYTSWTMFRTVADFHANKNGPGGVVLAKPFLPGQYIPNFSFFGSEGEFLVPGRVTGAMPTSPLGPGNPTGY